MGITKRLAGFLSGISYEDLPDDVIELTKSAILDWLGVAILGSTSKQGRIVVDLVQQMGGAKEATLIGTGKKAPCLNAALANGTMGHALELDDLFPSKGHPGTCIIPAALCLAEKEASDGRTLITSVLAGYETNKRIALSVCPIHYTSIGFHSTGTCGTFGAAAAASKVLGLKGMKMVHSLGLAGTQAAGVNESFKSDAKPLHAGKAAQAGVLSAVLASAGFSGADTILEGENGFCHAYTGGHIMAADLQEITRDLGTTYYIRDLCFKKYATANINATEAVYDLMRKNNISGKDVERITLAIPEGMFKPQGHYRHSTPTEAKTGLGYSIAVAVMDGRSWVEQFTKERIKDPAVEEFMERIEFYTDEEMDGVGVKVSMKTSDGKEFEGIMRHDEVKGSPKNPFTRNEFQEKFEDLASRVLPERNVEKLVTMLEDLEAMDDIREMTRLL